MADGRYGPNNIMEEQDGRWERLNSPFKRFSSKKRPEEFAVAQQERARALLGSYPLNYS